MDWQDFKWLNEPRKWSAGNKKLLVKTDQMKDFWRITQHDFVKDDGHFYYREMNGPFSCTLKFSGLYRDLYDQAGLMIRLDATTWIKAGIEFVDGAAKASVVVTRDFSDWSLVDLPEYPAVFWIRARRGKDHVEISCSSDGVRFALMRLAFFPAAASLQVGPMAASPKGEGFDVEFESLQWH
ncbi:hypothetical protein SAMN04488057_12328 [Cyclobacterium lianum]|uniref:Regulation of enolase protein 1, concanavalin A-like superfamily n=1 Tax=Cyclobacterium lianum TaxID=388280 RepID=A0A1M7QSI1_9BACT|nr:DUF1349 domain-containing protein [Cyclobacterium lianum]SHN34537.1 hypothetical protein SAMN04488057_12328 [Cyclobacterium lianum]